MADLVVQDVVVMRQGRRVVDRASFQVAPGEVLAVIGPNGAGKTSLLRAILGFTRARSCRVLFDGEQVSSLPERRRVFAYMPDEAEPPGEVQVRRIVDAATGSLAPDLVQKFVIGLGLSTLLEARAGSLSRGEKRRLLLFEALSAPRPVVVLDEPLGTFDPLQVLDVAGLLKACAGAGRALILSVHQLSDAQKVASRFLLLDAGRSVAQGTLADLRAKAGRPDAALEEIFLALLEKERRVQA